LLEFEKCSKIEKEKKTKAENPKKRGKTNKNPTKNRPNQRRTK
jgi:hypothetical protein